MGQQRHHKDLSKCHIIFHLSLICSVLGGCFSHCHPKIFREQSGQFSFEDPNHSSTIPPGKDRWLVTPNVLVYHGPCWELRHLPLEHIRFRRFQVQREENSESHLIWLVDSLDLGIHRFGIITPYNNVPLCMNIHVDICIIYIYS